jgi:hypothetical protein
VLKIYFGPIKFLFVSKNPKFPKFEIFV